MIHIIKFSKKIKCFIASVALPWIVDTVIIFFPNSARASRLIDRLIQASEGGE